MNIAVLYLRKIHTYLYVYIYAYHKRIRLAQLVKIHQPLARDGKLQSRVERTCALLLLLLLCNGRGNR